MNSHLEYIYKEFDQQQDDRGVSPISHNDCQIISELIDILLLQNNNQLAHIVGLWKDVADEEIIESLQNYQVQADNQDSDDQSNTQVKASEFIDIQGDSYRVSHIHNITIKQMYDDEINRMSYLIIVNDTQGHDVVGKMINSDATYTFYTQRQRDDALKDIKQRLESNNKIKFI